MYRWFLLIAVVISGSCVNQATAQISFGVARQNGVVTGGALQVGGFVTPGRTGAVLGLSVGTSQLIGVQNFTFQSGFNNRGGNNGGVQAAASRNKPRLSAGQFVKAAKRFDRDGNKRLDKEELTKIADAVVAQLRQQPAQTANANAQSFTAEQMATSFVERCLTFDKDKDEALDDSETKLMAAALIRSLS